MVSRLDILVGVDVYRTMSRLSALVFIMEATSRGRTDVYAALEREFDAGLINCGISLRWPFLTEAGRQELNRLLVTDMQQQYSQSKQSK